MISGVRDHVLALACFAPWPARGPGGMDRLPPGATAAIAGALVRSLDLAELGRAFLAVAEALPAERGRPLVPGDGVWLTYRSSSCICAASGCGPSGPSRLVLS
jgi:hypothetical protein